MTITDEKLSAFLDGELPPGEMADLRERIASDETLAARVEELALVDNKLTSAMQHIDDQPLPEEIHRLARALEQRKNKVVSLPLWKRAHQQVQHYAVAAAAVTAVVGFVLGNQLGNETQTAMPHWQNISAILEHRSGGRTVPLDEHNSMTTHLTFLNKQGEYCRQFSVDRVNARNSQNIACRRSGSWELEASLPVEAPANQQDYQLASGPGPIDEVIDNIASSAPLTAEEEQTVIENSWAK